MLGTAMTAIGMMWLAQIQPDSTYVSGLLGPMIVFALGLGFTFMPLTLAAVSQIDESDAGIASGVLNTTPADRWVDRPRGAHHGLRHRVRHQHRPTSWPRSVHRRLPLPEQLRAADGHRAPVDGWTSAFQVSAWLAVVAFIITLFAIKVTKEEAAHAGPIGGAADAHRIARRPTIRPARDRRRDAVGSRLRSRSGSAEPLRLPPLPGAVVGVLVLRSSHQRDHLRAQLGRRSLPGQGRARSVPRRRR